MENEAYIRLGAFALALATMNIYELCLPWRPHVRGSRWMANYGLIFVGVLLVRGGLPMGSTVFAYWVSAQGYGVFYFLDLHPIIAFILGLFLLDISIYGQHWFLHRWSWSWKFHRVHHCDHHLDASSALRFHPVEIFFSMIFKFVLVGSLGISALTILSFEIILNACAIFQHANIQIPPKVERFIRPLLVTPDMHRLHHSQNMNETNSNYGFSLSIWDRLLHTYTAPSRERGEIEIGLREEKGPHGLWELLRLPFFKQKEQKKRQGTKDIG